MCRCDGIFLNYTTQQSQQTQQTLALDGLELTTRRHAGSGVFCGQLQTVTEDILIFAVLVCSAH